MKTVFASALFVMASVLVIHQAHAYLPVEVQAFWNPQQVTFEVENVYAAPIFCTGQFFALTASSPAGEWLNFAIGPVVAGTWGYAYMVPPFVYSGDYFTSIPRTVAYCNFY